MDAVDIDVDNLFNDGGLDQILPTEHVLEPSTIAVPGLAEQFLFLRFCGGINHVSWSRQGHIAILSEDGSSVSIQCLRSIPKTKEWKLSTSEPLDAIFENAVNVTWSPTGFELAVIDSRGRIAVHSKSTTCLNRLNETRSALTDTPDELGMPIGTWWLTQDRIARARSIVSTATKEDDRWAHNMTKAKALGPFWPRALCVMDRQGSLTLLYQRPDARYTRTSTKLPLIAGTICSHAAFSSTTEGKILLAVNSTAGGLAVYHVQIVWPQDLMTDPASTSHPDLVVEVIDSCVSMWNDLAGINETLPQGYKPDDWILTHLTIVPTSDVETAVHQPPSIWAVYTSINPSLNAGSDGFLQNSVIRRWSVHALARDLHARFDDVPTKTTALAQDENAFFVERLTDMVFPQMVTSIELIDGGQMVAISTADGRTELWNPTTDALVSYEGQTNEITSLAQFGFAFHPSANAISTTLSPNACTTLTLTEEHNPSLHYAQYPVQTTTQELDLTDPHQSASVAAIILAFSRSCWSNSNGDDVLGCVLTNYTSHQYTAVMSEMYRTLFKDTEFIHEKAQGSEVERLLSKPHVIKLLSFQMALLNSSAISSNTSEDKIRFANLAGLWAWVAINLRYIATTLYIFYREHQQATQNQQNPNQGPPQPISPQFVDTICNTIHWMLDFFRFVVSTILEIGDRQTNPDFFTPPTFANNLGDIHGDGSQGLVALILNCQWTRTFLGAISRAMRAFIVEDQRSHTPLMARVVDTIRRYSVGKGMNITAVDKLLDSRLYVRTGFSDGEKIDHAVAAKRQISMYSSGRLGDEYAGTMRMLLEKVINEPETGLRATGEIERLKLWTDPIDLNWLLLGFSIQNLSHSPSTSSTRFAPNDDTRSFRPKSLYDVHRKSKIIAKGNPDQPIRRCVRCGSVSGDVDGLDKTWSKNMLQYLARCVCDASWILEPIEGEAERS